MPGVTTTAPDPTHVVADATCLPRLPVNGRLARTEIDLRAAGVAAAARDGAVSAAHARRVIAALLYGSSIPESVAAGWTADRQLRADIADRLREMLFTKVMQETSGGFALDRVADGASTCGWATQLCRAALRSAARDLRVRQRDRPLRAVGADLVSPFGCRSITELAETAGPAVPDVADTAAAGEPATGVWAAEAGLVVVSGMRPGSRRQRGAAHLQRALGLPGPARPADPAVRQRVAAILTVDTAAAHRSARAELARRQGTGADRADPLAVLWSGYPLPALRALGNRDHRYAHAVAMGAVAHRPAIRADVAAALAAQVRRADPDDPAWGDLAKGLVAAFLEHFSDLPSEFSPGAPHRRTEAGQPEECGGSGFHRARPRGGRLADGTARQRPGPGGDGTRGPAAAHRNGGRRPAMPARGLMGAQPATGSRSIGSTLSIDTTRIVAHRMDRQ